MKTQRSLKFYKINLSFRYKVQRKRMYVIIMDIIPRHIFFKILFDIITPKESCDDHITGAIVYNVLIYLLYNR